MEKSIGDFSVAKRIDEKPVQWSYECKICATRRKREWREKIFAENGKRAEELRAKKRIIQKRWRERNLEKSRAATRRYKEAVKADPERHVRFLEVRRIEYVLRREREGHRVIKKLSSAKMLSDDRERLPVRPLLSVIDEIIEQRKMFYTIGEVCADLGIDDRELRRWRTGECEQVDFNTAERALMAMGRDWEDVWPRQDYPAAYGGLLRND